MVDRCPLGCLGWQDALLSHLGDRGMTISPRASVHLAVVAQPYLGWILTGEKTIESRFSKNRVAPYESVKTGDVVALKASGRPVTAVCRIGTVEFYALTAGVFRQIRRRYSAALCTDAEFWRTRATSRYATIMRLSDVREITPVYCGKRDRRGWVTVDGTRRKRSL